MNNSTEQRSDCLSFYADIFNLRSIDLIPVAEFIDP